MITRKSIIASLGIMVIFSCVNGNNRQLRGFEKESLDGKSYLVIEEGSCEEYFLDDKIWPYKVGEKGVVSPGKHCLSCGENGKPSFTGTCFTVNKKKIFHFDYWGP